tara:strand:+ start:1407 stop:1622 length:216 start_codon:yes stop_codon:yes gene_type:complete
MADEAFALTDGEKRHPLWVRLSAHFEERLALLRRRNDAVQPEAQTAALRGEITCLKGIIALGKDSPPIDGW